MKKKGTMDLKAMVGGDMLGLLNQEDFIWVTHFNSESTKNFYSDFMAMESDPSVAAIPIYIASYGGQVYSLIGMRDLIKSSTKPVATICTGMAMSCGASLLAAGTKGMRFISPDSRVMIHEVASMNFGKSTDIQNDAKHTKELNDLMFGNLAKDCGISLEKLKKTIKDGGNVDLFLTAKEALQFGLVDQIAIPRTLEQPSRTHLIVHDEEDTVQGQLGVKKEKVRKVPLKLKKK